MSYFSLNPKVDEVHLPLTSEINVLSMSLETEVN